MGSEMCIRDSNNATNACGHRCVISATQCRWLDTSDRVSAATSERLVVTVRRPRRPSRHTASWFRSPLRDVRTRWAPHLRASGTTSRWGDGGLVAGYRRPSTTLVHIGPAQAEGVACPMDTPDPSGPASRARATDDSRLGEPEPPLLVDYDVSRRHSPTALLLWLCALRKARLGSRCPWARFVSCSPTPRGLSTPRACLTGG